jgi:hypothetical protein
MHSNKIIIQFYIGIALCTFISANALAEYEPNDNYSSFVLSYQSSKFASPVCVGGECHDTVYGPAIVYARQFVPNFALGMAGSQMQSAGKLSSVKSTNVSVFLQAIAGMGPSVDIGTSVAALNTSTDLCTTIPNTCTSSSDIGTDIGVFGKVFLTEKKTVSLTLGYNAIYFQKLPNESIIGLSLVGILARHHRLAVSVSSVRDQSGNEISGGLGFGYSYIVYY